MKDDKKKDQQEIKLTVAEAVQDDVGKGIVRMDSKIMKLIGVRPGEVVEIRGEKKTAAIVDRAYPGDIGLDIIRMDGLMRRNSKSGVGETVIIKKTKFERAKKVKVAPAQKNIRIQIDPESFKKGVLGRIITKGDIISLGGSQRRRDTLEGDFEEMFRNIMSGGFSSFGNFGVGNLKFIIVDTKPTGIPVMITDSTEIVVSEKYEEVSETETVPEVSYEDIGGLQEEVQKIREMVELPLKHPELFERLGIEPPKGVLLHGPPGTGKTLLAKAVANETNTHFININGPEIMSKYYGESEANLRKKFEEAAKNAPSIIFIDEIDAIAPKREESKGEVERRVVAQLLGLMDGIESRGKVIVIAATNIPNSIDPALRRPGRFDRELVIGVPNKKGREEILKIHTRNMPLAKNFSIKKIAEITHGFVGADLAALTREAAMIVLRRLLPKLKLEEETKIPKEMLEKLKIHQEDFIESLKVVRPSAMREILVDIPNIKFEDVGGLENIKQELIEAIEWPLKYKDSFKKIGINAPKGVLLYGPPGTGKTMIAKAVANESEANFILVKGPELLSKWVGESEKAVRKIFKKARETSPTIIFFDEMDALAPKRGISANSQVTERVVNQLLTEIDGLEELHDVVVIGATNRPDILDTALLRPGRFDRILMVGAPDKKSRKKIFEIHTKNMPLAKNVKIDELVEKTEGYSGADIESVCKEAGLLTMRENINAKEVNKKHFDEALEKVFPSITKEVEDAYKSLKTKFTKAKGEEMRREKPSYFG